MTVPPILCVTGPGGSGKTRLLEGVIPRLKAEGLRVAAVKHCSHIGRSSSGKDSDRLARAGAEPAVAAAAAGAEVCGACGELLLLDLVTTFCRGCDLVLAEGYHGSPYDKILLAAEDRTLDAGDFEAVRLTVSAEDIELVARWVLSWLNRRRAAREGLLGAVLTGGAGRRMGFDKSALTIAGRRVLGRLCELLADRTGQVMIVGRAPEGQGVPTCAAWHPDIRPGLGPLGGIATALHAAAATGRPAAVCVAACDMAGLGGEVLDLVLSGRDRRAPATVPVNPDTGRLEPLVAVYEPSARASIERSLESGRLSVTEWAETAGAHQLAVPNHLAGQLLSANTPEGLDAIRRRLEAGDT